MKLAALLVFATSFLAAQQPPTAPPAPPSTPAVAPQLTHTEQIALAAVYSRFQQVQQEFRSLIADAETTHPGYTLDPATLVLTKKPTLSESPAADKGDAAPKKK